MYFLELEEYLGERSREVKTESGNTSTGLSKKSAISRDHQPFDSNGSDTAGKQGVAGGKLCGSGKKKGY